MTIKNLISTTLASVFVLGLTLNAGYALATKGDCGNNSTQTSQDYQKILDDVRSEE